MNKLITLSLILLLSSATSSFGQIKTIASFEAKKFYYNNLVKTSNQNVIAIDVHYGFKKTKYKLTKIDANMSNPVSREVEIGQSKNDQTLLSYFSFADNFYVFKAHETQSKLTGTIQVIDQNTLLETGEEKLLFEVDHKDEFVVSKITSSVSPDGKYLVLNVPNLGAFFIDNTLTNILKSTAGGDIEGLTIHTEHVTNNGDYYQVYTKAEDQNEHKNESVQLMITRTNLEGDIVTSEIKNERLLFEPIITFDDAENIIVAGSSGNIATVASWSSTHAHGADLAIRQGYFIVKFDNKLNQLSATFEDYSNELILEGLKPSVIKKAEKKIEKGLVLGYEFLNLFQLIPTKSGFFLIGEDYIYETITDPITKDKTNIRYHGTILVLELDKDGGLVDYHKIFKSQSSDYFGGYDVLYANDKLSILFNDLKYNENVETMNDVTPTANTLIMNVYVVEIHNGEVTKSRLTGHVWKNNIMIPKRCFTIDNELYIYAENGQKKTIAKLRAE